jgi:hypothetical protein
VTERDRQTMRRPLEISSAGMSGGRWWITAFIGFSGKIVEIIVLQVGFNSWIVLNFFVIWVPFHVFWNRILLWSGFLCRFGVKWGLW